MTATRRARGRPTIRGGLLFLAAAAIAAVAKAQQDEAELVKKTQNPVADLVNMR